MARLSYVALEIHGGVAKRPRRHRLGGFHRPSELVVAIDAPHADATATGGRFDEQGESHFAGGFLKSSQIARDESRAPWQYRNAGCLGKQASTLFVAHVLDGLRIGADPAHVGSHHGARKIFAFGKESIPRVDCLGAGDTRGLEDAICGKVALGRRSVADKNGSISERRVECG
jgi:hypothetical protein